VHVLCSALAAGGDASPLIQSQSPGPNIEVVPDLGQDLWLGLAVRHESIKQVLAIVLRVTEIQSGVPLRV